MPLDLERQLLDMLQTQIVDRGINDPRILEAMQRAPRHLFVPSDALEDAYKDRPLTLPEEQATISQPYMVAYMTGAAQIQPSDRVLEIGTGSGYQAAILSYLCKEVYTIERHYTLSINAQRTLHSLGCNNVHFKIGDGLEGWAEHAPYDKILVTAAGNNIPPILIEQLKDGGSLLMPLGEPRIQTMTRVTKRKEKQIQDRLISCVFVPLISQMKDLTQSTPPDDHNNSNQQEIDTDDDDES